jgi:hypothetical protein
MTFTHRLGPEPQVRTRRGGLAALGVPDVGPDKMNPRGRCAAPPQAALLIQLEPNSATSGTTQTGTTQTAVTNVWSGLVFDSLISFPSLSCVAAEQLQSGCAMCRDDLRDP